MANRKVGFNYYSIETDRYQDIRIKRLKKDFSCTGIAVYDYILNEIYRVKGCFIEWDECTVFDVADYFGIKESVVSEVVNYCCVVGLFDKELLTNESIITSTSIQIRFVDWSIKAKRLNSNRILITSNIPDKYNILPEESNILQEVTPNTSGKLPQSKETESKETESKVSLSKTEREILFQFFVFEKNVKQPLLELDRFCDHYTSVGWKDANGNEIIDKVAKAKMWTPKKKGLRADAVILKKWEQVFIQVFKASGENAFWLLHFTPKIVDGKMMLEYQKFKDNSLRSVIAILEEHIGDNYFSAIKMSFKEIAIEYSIYKN